MKYDDASWHSGGEFPPDSPQEYGGTHIGIFLKWCFKQGWAGDLHTDEENDAVLAVVRGEMTGTDFLFKYCDGKFTDEDLNDDGNHFASSYYDSFYTAAYKYLFPHQIYLAPESEHDVERLFQQLDKKLRKASPPTGQDSTDRNVSQKTTAEISDIAAVRAAAKLVLTALETHLPDSDYTESVERAMRILDDPVRTLEAVGALRAMAHPKALGDIYPPGMQGFDWLNLVSSLSWCAGEYIRKYDPNRPTGRVLGYSKEELRLLTKTALPTHVYEPPDFHRRWLGINWSSISSFVQSSPIRFLAKFLVLPAVVVLATLLLIDQ